MRGYAFRACLLTILPLGLLIVLGPREASATARGCSLYSMHSAPNWEDAEPDCGISGDGCYNCSYHNTGQNGYTICAENPDGTGPFNGKPLCDSVAEIPPDWPAPDPDITDPTPGDPPPDAPPPDSPPGDDTGDPGGPGSGTCDGSPSHDCSDSIVIREVPLQAQQGGLAPSYSIPSLP